MTTLTQSTPEEALDRAEKIMADVQVQAIEVHQIANSLRSLRERNRFAESIEEAIRRKK